MSDDFLKGDTVVASTKTKVKPKLAPIVIEEDDKPEPIECSITRDMCGEDIVYRMNLGSHTAELRTAVEPNMIWLKNFLVTSAAKLHKFA